MFSGKSLARAIGYYSMILALGVAAGQIFGGLIIGANFFGYSWRVAFLLNVPVGLAILFLARKYLPVTPRKEGVKLDLVGVPLLGVSMALFVLPLMFGRSQGWPLWSWVSLAVGIAGIGAFLRYELNLIAKGGRPLLDLRAMRPKGVKPGILALCLLNFAFGGILFPLTLHLQTALHYEPIQAGLMFIPYPVGFATVSLTWTKYAQKWQDRLPIIGLIIFSLTCAALAYTVRIGWPVPLAAVFLLIGGASMAGAMSPLINQVAATAGPKFAAETSALLSTGSLMFSVLSVTTAGGLYLSFAENDVTRSVTGITWAFGLDAVLLAVATVCAIRVWYLTVRPAAVPGPATGDPVIDDPAAVEAAPDAIEPAEAVAEK
jgi:MFS family permease